MVAQHLAAVLVAAGLALTSAGELRGGEWVGGSPNATIEILDDAGADGVGARGAACDAFEAFFQAMVRESCNTKKAVTCVYARWPDCTAEDICNFRHGCGYVEDNTMVKFTGYTCSGSIGWGPKDPTANARLDCDSVLTPTAVALTVVGVLLVVFGCACLTWCFCCKGRR
mmetsp:Transcript_101314/g.292993  ORF Transcript_101314/g.292993 Transcript_101314/m.292993 type:complete len:170 (-) Transcript_101314:185-694(-)